MNLGAKLIFLRKKSHLTQEQMAEILDIKRARYNAWENEISKPDLGTLVKIAKYHKVTTDYLLGGENMFLNEEMGDQEYMELIKKIEEKGAKLEATALLRSVGNGEMKKETLRDILKAFAIIERNEK